MQRRGESGQPVKGWRGLGPKARKAPTAHPSPAELQEQVDSLTRERDEALEQQKATSEVLRVISKSPIDLVSVMGAIAESAARLLDATDAGILRVESGVLRLVAKHGPSPNFGGNSRSISRNWVAGRAVVDRTTVCALDLQVEEIEFPEGAAYAKRFGHRTTLATPLLREGNAIGVILIRRMIVKPFTEHQTALLKSFADQAIIAIENVRLFEAEQQRTAELTESLEQQTATSEVLRAISSSPGELEPVFNAMLENATRICEAKFGNLLLYEEGVFRRVALHNAPQAWAADWQRDPRGHRGSSRFLYRVADTKQLVHIPDVALEGPNEPVHRLAGARTLLIVPLLKESELIGAVGIYRQEVRPFTDKQIELVQNFAAQAVIAIENTRLLKELRQRTDDLSESLQQQTATADVLKVISSSPGELEPVFNAILENAVRICDAKFGHLRLLNRHVACVMRKRQPFGAPRVMRSY